MIKTDRALLARMTQLNTRMTAVNTSMGEIVIRMLARQDGGELDAEDLRAIGQGLATLGADITELGSDLLKRADDRHAISS